MRTDVLRLDLRLRRRMLAGTAVGAAAYLLLVVAIYPSFKGDTSVNHLVAANPQAAAAFGITGSITSPAGWLGANMYANIAPLLALLLTIGYGASAIAGQNAEGLLGAVASCPIGRARVVLQKGAALLCVALVVPLAALIACLAGPRFDLSPDWGALLGVTAGLTLLAFDLGALALVVGALTGSQGVALAAAGGIAAAAYLVSTLSPVVSVVHGVRCLSPVFWAVGDSTGSAPARSVLFSGSGRGSSPGPSWRSGGSTSTDGLAGLLVGSGSPVAASAGCPDVGRLLEYGAIRGGGRGRRCRGARPGGGRR